MDTELAKNPLAELSPARKIVLSRFSKFLDTFNTSALFSAIPVIATSARLNNSQSSGPTSGIYNSELVFEWRVFTFPFMALSGVLQQKFEAKYILLGGLILMVAGTIFFPFADNASHYWPIVLPGFLLGTARTTLMFCHHEVSRTDVSINLFPSIAIFAATPPAVAGTVGAVFDCVVRLDTAVIASVATSLQTSVQPSPTSFEGRSAVFEFLIAFVVLQIISVLFFVRTTGTMSTVPSTQPEGPAGRLPFDSETTFQEGK